MLGLTVFLMLNKMKKVPPPSRLCFHLCLFACWFVSRITHKWMIFKYVLFDIGLGLIQLWGMLGSGGGVLSIIKCQPANTS